MSLEIVGVSVLAGSLADGSAAGSSAIVTCSPSPPPPPPVTQHHRRVVVVVVVSYHLQSEVRQPRVIFPAAQPCTHSPLCLVPSSLSPHILALTCAAPQPLPVPFLCHKGARRRPKRTDQAASARKRAAPRCKPIVTYHISRNIGALR